jgi:hypothetical protein
VQQLRGQEQGPGLRGWGHFFDAVPVCATPFSGSQACKKPRAQIRKNEKVAAYFIL